ncbi:WhiB family transcriptional regulator [Streptomyces coelicoflavus]|uniref:WhiB family transcriptional regulator n=1 Tax=Streptomyces coelicoflavus TaxID=285562 RepID=UPI003679DC7C
MTAVRDWEQLSACQGYDPDLWFSDRTRGRAIAICDGCLVRKECLATVLAREDGVAKGQRLGIAAGLTGAQRWGLARRNTGISEVRTE